MKRTAFHLPALRTLALAALLGTGAMRPAALHAQATYIYWDGDGSNANLGTAANWRGNAAPTNDGNANVVFTDQYFAAGGGDLNPNLEVNWFFNSLTFAGGSAFTLGSTNNRGLNIGSGITQNSTAAQTISVPTFLTDDQTWSFASGAGALNFTTTSASGQIINQGHTLTLSAAGTNTLNGAISGTGAVVASGAGTMTLTGNNTYSGGTTFAAGTLNAGSTGALGSTGTLSFSGGTLQLSAANTTDYSGRFSQAASQAYSIDTNGQNATLATALTSSGGSLTKVGAGTLTLTTNETYTGGTTVSGGTLAVGNGGSVTGDGVSVQIGATLAISGTGSISTGKSSTLILDGTSASPASVTLGGAGSLSTGLTTIGYGGAGSFTQSGGSFTTNGNPLYLGDNGGSGSYTLDGTGSLSTGYTVIGDAGAGTFTQSGGSFTTNGNPLYLGYNGGSGSYALSGGLLNVSAVTGDGDKSTTTFNFNGGTLQASASGTRFLEGLTTANVQAGGALIDTNGFSVTVAQNLVHDAASGAPAADGGLTKLGAGTLTLTGASTYTGATTISAGTLQVGSGSTSGSLGTSTGAITDNGTLAYDRSDNVSVANAISGSGGLTQLGTGTLTLSGASTYTGATTVSAGTLAITGHLTSPNATLTVDGPGTGTAALSLSGGGLSTGLVYVGLNGSGTLTQSGGSFNAGSAPLNVGFGSGSSGVYTLGGATSSLSVSGVNVGLNGSGTFTQSGGSLNADNNALGSGVFLGYFANSSGTYNLNGGTLTTGFVQGGKSGSSGTSTFYFNGGTLQASGSNANFIATLTAANVQAGGARVDTNGFNVSVAQPLLHDTTSGAPATDGGLTKLGAGTLTLLGSSTYTGGTTVSGGTLLAANTTGSATGTGAVQVNNTGTLAGNGTVAGAVSVASGGTLSPGLSLSSARLTLGNNLVLNAGSTLAIGLGGTTAGTFGQVELTGTLGLAGNLSVTAVNGFTLAVGQTFVILDDTSNAGGVIGSFADAPGGIYTDAAGDRFQVNYLANADGGSVPNDVTITVVPEPGTWAMLGLGFAGLGLSLCRRTRRA